MATPTPAGRQTILPPPPSLPRMLLAFATALWFLAISTLHKRMDGLLRYARRGTETSAARLTPAAPPVSGLRERGTLPLFAALQQSGSAPASASATAASPRRSAATAVG